MLQRLAQNIVKTMVHTFTIIYKYNKKKNYYM
jgi:hypothetical protein